jgi:hypothetical protein
MRKTQGQWKVCWNVATALSVLYTRWRWLVSFTPWPLDPREETLYTPWVGGWIGPRDDLDAVEKRKICFPAENRIPIPRLSIPQHSHYTEWAIPFYSRLTTQITLNRLRCNLFDGHNTRWWRSATCLKAELGICYRQYTKNACGMLGVWSLRIEAVALSSAICRVSHEIEPPWVKRDVTKSNDSWGLSLTMKHSVSREANRSSAIQQTPENLEL